MKNNIQFWSFLEIKALDATAEEAATIHTNRRCIVECAETIPGFQYGETLISIEDPSLATVVCGWTDKSAYEEWQQSPIREKQLQDLAGLVKVESKEHSFKSFYKFTSSSK